MFVAQRNEIISNPFHSDTSWIDPVFVFFISEFHAKAEMHIKTDSYMKSLFTVCRIW